MRCGVVRLSIPVSLLAACVGACASPAPPAESSIGLVGRVTREGHYDRPHATRTLPIAIRFAQRGSCVRCELIEMPRTGKVTTVLVRDAQGREWTKTGDASEFRPSPPEDARFLAVASAALSDGEHDAVLAFRHPRLGDVADSATWSGAEDERELRIVWQRPTDSAEFVVHRPKEPGAGTDVSFEVPPTERTEATAADTGATAAVFRTIADGVHEITLPAADTRSLAIEFADHVVLCEASLDNEAGTRLLAAIDEHLPGKPVRYVAFGHYHPHYTGGLRPVMARGATVVSPPLGAAFAREIASRPFLSPPDELAASGRAPAIETFVGERTFRDGTNELVLVDIGEDSHHTVEYVVFWLPRQRILFQGDLGWYGVGAGIRAGGERARGMLAAIDARKLPVETLVQGWPATGRSSLPLVELRALLAK